ncbi:hypothetical protein [Methylobacterium nigriterrae]|uniref:hypothetical protein n=1 Tax=Methylobacterium nigriterrae TaxID=3127512 RepID=UPI003013EB89
MALDQRFRIQSNSSANFIVARTICGERHHAPPLPTQFIIRQLLDLLTHQKGRLRHHWRPPFPSGSRSAATVRIRHRSASLDFQILGPGKNLRE